MIEQVLAGFGLDGKVAEYKKIGNGLINNTWKVSGSGGEYILQKVNTNVFSEPKEISANMVMIKEYLDKVAPGYFFVGPLTTKSGEHVFETENGVYRLFPYVPDSTTIDEVRHAGQAYHAAKQFGKFTRMLAGYDPLKLNVPIRDFHNLPFRLEQYQQALTGAGKDRLERAQWAIEEIKRHVYIVDDFKVIIQQQKLNLRVIHHDTKISNVLLNATNGDGICVIDLDTVMPGYFISDVGDMMRTYLSPANEEETKFQNISVRLDVFEAIHKGYMEEMDEVLNDSEKELFIYSGKFMIFMQALRFLTDFLNGDIYYRVSGPDHNLNRAVNQIVLLNRYIESEEAFQSIVNSWRYQDS
ncbi:aminoglycoside phosphotransferase family protein [Mucilaginibacter mali]|uniref:Aminoglycoside phosphotransferase family protein n=1 Tax=Mucilaginibacter mali TaxID=2740462 RepID=A0A7D4QUF0_9SPHI|nr:aminoglycoside phosphotransferase family protein [Mucilaginibacter mali]QKJ31089.1 aminoglycoside phosphotransferase family protein [Mucilaginibacter mali]